MVSTACGDKEEFTIKCNIEGLDTRGIEMVYATRSGLARASFHPVGGKVELHGSSEEPTLVEIFTLDGSRLATLVMANGDEAELTMKLDDPTSLRVKGQDASRDYSAFVAEHDSLLNRGNDAEVNALIARSVKDNPKSIASTLLMVTRFRTPGHELEADSLMSLIAPEARPRFVTGAWASSLGEQLSTSARGEIKMFTIKTAKDTTARLSPSMQSYALMAFIADRKPDSTFTTLRDLREDAPKRRLAIMEISLAPDSARWRETIRRDTTATWVQAWPTGGVASTPVRRLAIPRTPYYIVIDSTGAQRYRGASLHTADTLLRSLLNLNELPDSAINEEIPR